MHNLKIFTKLNSIVVVGEFCDWEPSRGFRVDKINHNKYICVDNMPKGEYRILSCKSYIGGEINPDTGNQMSNRYFGDAIDEIITCYFNKEDVTNVN